MVGLRLLLLLLLLLLLRKAAAEGRMEERRRARRQKLERAAKRRGKDAGRHDEPALLLLLVMLLLPVLLPEDVWVCGGLGERGWVGLGKIIIMHFNLLLLLWVGSAMRKTQAHKAAKAHLQQPRVSLASVVQ